MAAKLSTGWIKIATEGKTVDGREIFRQWIADAADTYQTATYTALINWEHFRYYGNFGEVIATKAQENEDGKLCLFVQLSPNKRLLAQNSEGQSLFTSAEFTPNFADTGKAYLTGLAVTDSPASLGTERLSFSRKEKGDDTLEYCSCERVEMTEIISKEDQAAGLLSGLFALFNKQQPEEPEEQDSMETEQFNKLTGALEAIAAGQTALAENLEKFSTEKPPKETPPETPEKTEGVTSEQFSQLTQSITKMAEGQTTLTEKFTALMAEKDGTQTPDHDGQQEENTLVL